MIMTGAYEMRSQSRKSNSQRFISLERMVCYLLCLARQNSAGARHEILYIRSFVSCPEYSAHRSLALSSAGSACRPPASRLPGHQLAHTGNSTD